MINFGTVGTGWITESFIQAAKLSGQLQLTSVYSRTEDKAKQLADTYNASLFLYRPRGDGEEFRNTSCIYSITQFCSF